MEMGEVRFEASISIAFEDAAELGTRVEIKNLNSFRAVVGGVSYEIVRQTKALDKGEQLHQELGSGTPSAMPRTPCAPKKPRWIIAISPSPTSRRWRLMRPGWRG